MFSTGEASSEEEVLDSGEEDSESTEEKDHLGKIQSINDNLIMYYYLIYQFIY